MIELVKRYPECWPLRKILIEIAKHDLTLRFNTAIFCEGNESRRNEDPWVDFISDYAFFKYLPKVRNNN